MNSEKVYRELSLYGVLSNYAKNLLCHTMGKAGLKKQPLAFSVDMDCAGGIYFICNVEKKSAQTEPAEIKHALEEGFKALSWATLLNFKVFNVENTNNNRNVKITLSL